jgi:Flp pilus assembly pilin Flp
MQKTVKAITCLPKDDRGVAAIEFALIMPILALILMGMVDYTLYLQKKLAIQQLSRQAAEYVVQGGQEAAAGSDIIEQSSLFTDTPAITYDTDTTCECMSGLAVDCQGNCGGDDYMRSFFEVSISGTYTPILPYPGLEDNVTLTAYTRLQFAR